MSPLREPLRKLKQICEPSILICSPQAQTQFKGIFVVLLHSPSFLAELTERNLTGDNGITSNGIKRNAKFLQVSYVNKAGQSQDALDVVIVAKLRCAAGLANLEVKKHKLAAQKLHNNNKKFKRCVVFQLANFEKSKECRLAMELGYGPDQRFMDHIWPHYRNKKGSSTSEFSVKRNSSVQDRLNSIFAEAPAVLVPSLTSSRSIRKAKQEVKMVWQNVMKACEIRGKELLDGKVITLTNLDDWLKAKHGIDVAVVHVDLPCYTFLRIIFYSIKVGSDGLFLLEDLEITHLNRPKDRLLYSLDLCYC
ncbi:hypothetical protein T459_23979 [Capsicum annuum]|uniref:Uncharacterized protein n=1 Tax=Capsicum annuum TaxID=4072 RepID=A0A2G2YU18_CAPAN|nr:hypothetical protein T459_23979 [Capsicum annuum]